MTMQMTKCSELTLNLAFTTETEIGKRLVSVLCLNLSYSRVLFAIADDVVVVVVVAIFLFTLCTFILLVFGLLCIIRNVKIVTAIHLLFHTQLSVWF